MGRKNKKERMATRKNESAQKDRDTVLLLLSVFFLAGGVLGYIVEGKFSAGGYIRQFLAQATQNTLAPSLSRVLWSVFRWPVAAVVLSLLPMAGLTVPALFLLRGFFLSYGIVTLIEGMGAAGILWSGIVFGPTCLLAVPTFFVLGTAGLLRKAAVQGPNGKLMRRVVICVPVLLLCVCLDQMAAPKLLHFFLCAFSGHEA